MNSGIRCHSEVVFLGDWYFLYRFSEISRYAELREDSLPEPWRLGGEVVILLFHIPISGRLNFHAERDKKNSILKTRITKIYIVNHSN